MKRLILKTASITFVASVVVLVSVFGVLSLCAPAFMSNLTGSLGLDGLSADYAYQEYGRSKDLSYLARSFEIAAAEHSDKKAAERFEKLYGDANFNSFCEERDAAAYEGAPVYRYRAYVCGQGACVKYRLAETEEEKNSVAAFAAEETESTFPAGNPLVFLAVEAAGNKDKSFCTVLLQTMQTKGFEQNGDYRNIVKILEECANE